MILRKIKRYVPCRVRPDYDPAHHCHVIEVVDIATGVAVERGYPLTAFRWRCKICGHVFDVIETYGIEQLQAGHAPAQVFEWLDAAPG